MSSVMACVFSISVYADSAGLRAITPESMPQCCGTYSTLGKYPGAAEAASRTLVRGVCEYFHDLKKTGFSCVMSYTGTITFLLVSVNFVSFAMDCITVLFPTPL